MPVTASTVSPICRVPPRKTGLFNLESASPESSMPMVNKSMATPISATWSMTSLLLTTPRSEGPQSTPVSKKPTVAGSLRRLQTMVTTMERRKRITNSYRNGTSIYSPARFRFDYIYYMRQMLPEVLIQLIKSIDLCI